MTQPVMFAPKVIEACPDLRLGLLQAQVTNSPSSPALTGAIETACQQVADQLAGEPASSRPEIAATRRFYKALGKDPARYRPSAEALTRRALQGKGLYTVSAAVDVTNLISLQSGLSIGAYDRSKIKGAVTMRPGAEGEPYEAIGRGPLNIANLPVFSDREGAFGSPTSDSTRTSLRLDTTALVMMLIACSRDTPLDHWLQAMSDTLRDYCQAMDVETEIYSVLEA